MPFTDTELEERFKYLLNKMEVDGINSKSFHSLLKWFAGLEMPTQVDLEAANTTKEQQEKAATIEKLKAELAKLESK